MSFRLFIILFIGISLKSYSQTPVTDFLHIALKQADDILEQLDSAIDYTEQALQTKEQIEHTLNLVLQNEQMSDLRSVIGDARKLSVRIERLNERAMDVWEDVSKYDPTNTDGKYILDEIMKKKYDRKYGAYNEETDQFEAPEDPDAIVKDMKQRSFGVDGPAGKAIAEERNKIAQAASDRAQKADDGDQTQISLQQHSIALLNNLIQMLNAQANADRLENLAQQAMRDKEIYEYEKNQKHIKKNKKLGNARTSEALSKFEKAIDEEFKKSFYQDQE